MIVFRLSQELKAEPPILVTFSGIVMDVNLLQALKAELPIDIKLLGRDIDVNASFCN